MLDHEYTNGTVNKNLWGMSTLLTNALYNPTNNSINILLGILDERVDDILENVEEGCHYDENMEMLDMNIRTLTSLIQGDVQQYIYDEATNMEMLRREVASGLLTTIRVLVILLIAIILFIYIVSNRLSKTITTPVTELVDMTEKFAGGDFTVSYHPESHDEMEILAESFNSMVKEIETLVEDIHKEQEILLIHITLFVFLTLLHILVVIGNNWLCSCL